MALTDNLVAYWKLEGNSNDAAGSNNGTDTNITYSSANGKIGQGAGFNGSSSNISTNVTSLAVSSFSVSAWVNIADFTNPHTIFAQGNSSSNNPIISITILSGGSSVELVKRDNTPVGLVATPSYTFSTGQWYHIVWTLSPTQSILYINNSSVSTDNFTANAGTFNTQYIGVRKRISFDGYFSGAIDEVGLWTRVLSSAEVSQLYNNGSGLNPYAILYTLTATSATLTLTGETINIPLAVKMVINYGSFVLTGVNILLRLAYTLLAQTGSFILTGINSIFTLAWRTVLSSGSFTLTGVNIILSKGYNLLVNTGLFSLTSSVLRFLINGSTTTWLNISKSVSSWVTSVKNNVSWTNSNKNNSSWTNQEKS